MLFKYQYVVSYYNYIKIIIITDVIQIICNKTSLNSEISPGYNTSDQYYMLSLYIYTKSDHAVPSLKRSLTL